MEDTEYYVAKQFHFRRLFDKTSLASGKKEQKTTVLYTHFASNIKPELRI